MSSSTSLSTLLTSILNPSPALQPSPPTRYKKPRSRLTPTQQPPPRQLLQHPRKPPQKHILHPNKQHHDLRPNPHHLLRRPRLQRRPPRSKPMGHKHHPRFPIHPRRHDHTHGAGRDDRAVSTQDVAEEDGHRGEGRGRRWAREFGVYQSDQGWAD